MASLYLDEDIQNAATDLLREYGHAVTHARDYRKSAKDDVQLLLAAQAGWILVTNNQRDFFLLHDAWHHWSKAWGVAPRHAGILLTRNTWAAPQLAERVHEFFTDHRPTENRLYRWTAGVRMLRYRVSVTDADGEHDQG